MKKKLLLKAAEALRANAKNKQGCKFDLAEWGHATPNSEPSVSCGTTACAMGLFAIAGTFKRQGLRYRTYNKYKRNSDEVLHVAIEPYLDRKDIYDEDDWGWLAPKGLFKITAQDAVFLFSGAAYPKDERKAAEGERAVAKRITRFVKTNGESAKAWATSKKGKRILELQGFGYAY